MINILVAALVIVLISFILLGFNIFFRKKSFPESEIGRNKDMRKLGLTCPKCDELKLYRKQKPAKKIDPEDLTMAPTPTGFSAPHRD
ncbi:MAG: hypothetical protein JXR41_03395 [Bacteroidales bacterium]|nr:hypothetical protein [Bacteroidales bacterium]MBN2762111.1 hypothetical protein [Bacteroidales bacterium]